MKKNLLFLPLVLAGLALGSCSKYDDSALSGRVTNVEGRVSKLEEQVKVLNSDIVAIRTLITALQSNDYVTKVELITEDSRSGYRISFTKSNPITIFHGTNGRDGQNGANGRDGVNGANGRDGVSPVIGVRQEGGIYYWTLNGEWLTDAQGQKVKAQGADGRNGQDGTPGRDGVTPQVRIQNDYWEVSYDNGQTWQSLNVKARGEDAVSSSSNPFSRVENGERILRVFLQDGTEIKLPKEQSARLVFIDSPLIEMGESYSDRKPYRVRFRLEGDIQGYKLALIRRSDGSRIVMENEREGAIYVRNRGSYTEWEMVLISPNGETLSYFVMAYFSEMSLVLEGEAPNSYVPIDEFFQAVPSEGKDMKIYILAPFHEELKEELKDVQIAIPSEASSWVSLVSNESLRSSVEFAQEKKQVITLRVKPNLRGWARRATIKIAIGRHSDRSFEIYQSGQTQLPEPSMVLSETLLSIYDYEIKGRSREVIDRMKIHLYYTKGLSLSSYSISLGTTVDGKFGVHCRISTPSGEGKDISIPLRMNFLSSNEVKFVLDMEALRASQGTDLYNYTIGGEYHLELLAAMFANVGKIESGGQVLWDDSNYDGRIFDVAYGEESGEGSSRRIELILTDKQDRANVIRLPVYR